MLRQQRPDASRLEERGRAVEASASVSLGPVSHI